MDQPLKSPGQSALEDTFHRLLELSRSEPAATLEQRLDRLARLRAVIADNEARFEAAISSDFGHRCATETLFAEQIFVLGEIKHTARHLKKWMAPRRIATALQFMPARNRLIPQPLGVVGIIAPWNYPLQLTLAPAVGAIAAGNRVMIKPSELVPRFSTLLKEVISAKFDASEMVVTGVDEEIAKAFASLPFDHLIFTGSTRVGRLVAEAAGRNLTPITLELGGKSPAIVDRSADLAEAAERIAYGKLLNAGQTCIAPDYALVPEAQVQDFAEKVQASMQTMFGTVPQQRLHLGGFRPALCAARRPGGGRRRQGRADHAAGKTPSDPAWKSKRKFPPTILVGASPDMTIMQEEIFGPLLPVIGYKEPRSRSPISTGMTDRWRCTGSARTMRRATRCWRAPSPAASPSTTACSTLPRSTSRWAASARPAPAPITANGALTA